jgi:hypothetical protein
MSDSENYETTFNHFLLHFLRYSCNFCPNTCTQEAKLIKVSHLGVVTLLYRDCRHRFSPESNPDTTTQSTGSATVQIDNFRGPPANPHAAPAHVSRPISPASRSHSRSLQVPALGDTFQSFPTLQQLVTCILGARTLQPVTSNPSSALNFAISQPKRRLALQRSLFHHRCSLRSRIL